MGFNFALMVYAPNFDQWARPIIFYPVASQPGAVNGLNARGIWHRDQLEEVLEDGSLFVSHRVSLDILEMEFPILPEQSDQLFIPIDASGPAEGTFEVESITRNGGGEATLVLRKIVAERP